ncbi:MAG TPA: TIGR02266 family protein, partial [Kofleriaceae bacterium]|nr:TIGR02266 family protein [Kofleriaceae bacterium]
MTERVSQRIPYTVQVEFRTASSFLIAYSLNVSRGGLFLELDQEVPIGAAVTLEFVVPGIGNTAAEGVVTWRRGRGSADGPAGIGIEFQEVSEALGETIDQLVTAFSGLSIVLMTGERPDRTLARSIKSIMSTAQVVQATDAQLAAKLLADDIDLVVVDIDGGVEGGLA